MAKRERISEFEALGKALRIAREQRSLSLLQVEKQIHIRAKFLDALEQGQIDQLPSPVQARGFLRNYGRYLGFDDDLLQTHFDEALNGGRRRRSTPPIEIPEPPIDVQATQPSRTYQPPPPISTMPPTMPRRPSGMNPRPTGVNPTTGKYPLPPTASTPNSVNKITVRPESNPEAYTTPVLPRVPRAKPRPDRTNETGDRPPRAWGRWFSLLLGMLILIGLGIGSLLVFQNGNSENGTRETFLSTLATRSLDLSSTSFGIASTLAATETPIRPTLLPNPNAPSTPVSSGDVVMQLEVVARTWLRVTVDDQVAYIGAPGPNTVLQYRGNRINVRIANAAGVKATVSGRNLGVLGARGQIFDQTFTVTGILVSTSTPSSPTPGG